MEDDAHQTSFVKVKDIKADWELFKLIIFNLCQNAVKYNKFSGEVEISFDLKINSKE